MGQKLYLTRHGTTFRNHIQRNPGDLEARSAYAELPKDCLTEWGKNQSKVLGMYLAGFTNPGELIFCATGHFRSHESTQFIAEGAKVVLNNGNYVLARGLHEKNAWEDLPLEYRNSKDPKIKAWVEENSLPSLEVGRNANNILINILNIANGRDVVAVLHKTINRHLLSYLEVAVPVGYGKDNCGLFIFEKDGNDLRLSDEYIPHRVIRNSVQDQAYALH